MTKDSVRRFVLSERQALETSFSEEMSEIICNKFYKDFSHCCSFLMYWPIKSEVNILPLIEKFHAEEKRVYLPAVKGGNIIFKKFEGISRMIKGSFNILEPQGEPLAENADVIVVPAVAYDYSCNRLGYGKGFYDRFMADGYSSVKVGIIYDFQLVETVYPESHDKPVDVIITEKRVVRRNG